MLLEAYVAFADGFICKCVPDKVQVLDFAEAFEIFLELLLVHVLQREVAYEQFPVFRAWSHISGSSL
jgi:hypothetical protein